MERTKKGVTAFVLGGLMLAAAACGTASAGGDPGGGGGFEGPCLHSVEAKAQIDLAVEDIFAAADDAGSYDVSGANDHLTSAVSYLREASDYVAADPAISGAVSEAANDLESAAYWMTEGEIDQATTFAQMATQDLTDAKDATLATEVPACSD